MKHSLLALAILYCVVPSFAAATATPLSRRDGFLLIWSSIHRPAEQTSQKPFSDVPSGGRGELVITFAKSRGMIDSSDGAFHPDEPLQLTDALLWMLRTRNVDAPDALTSDQLPTLAMQFGLESELTPGSSSGRTVLSKALSEDDLTNLLRKFDAFLAHQSHEVSLYSEKFQGKGTAFGEQFDMNALTAAHRTFPYNTRVKVTNVANGKSVLVRINDRGPYVAGRDMDLSLAAFTQIADRSQGKIQATFERIGDVNLVGPCSSAARNQIRITKDVRLVGGIPNIMHLGTHLTLKANMPFDLLDVTYPDGTNTRYQHWIYPSAGYDFTPAVEGLYVFHLGTIQGRIREMSTTAVKCT